jgi:hypothetical protein
VQSIVAKDVYITAYFTRIFGAWKIYGMKTLCDQIFPEEIFRIFVVL